jgi:predicted phage tail protein
MKDSYMKSPNHMFSHRWWAFGHPVMGTGCRMCRHEVTYSPMAEEPIYAARIRRKRMWSTFAIVVGVCVILLALFFLIHAATIKDAMIWFMFSMVVGLAITFAGIDTLLFGYQNAEDRAEASGESGGSS